MTELGDYAFAGCSGLKEFDMKNVTTIGAYCFSNCTGLKKVNLRNVTRLKVGAFDECTGIDELDLRNVTTIDLWICLDWTSNQKIIVPFSSPEHVPNGWSWKWDSVNGVKLKATIIYTDS